MDRLIPVPERVLSILTLRKKRTQVPQESIFSISRRDLMCVSMFRVHDLTGKIKLLMHSYCIGRKKRAILFLWKRQPLPSNARSCEKRPVAVIPQLYSAQGGLTSCVTHFPNLREKACALLQTWKQHFAKFMWGLECFYISHFKEEYSVCIPRASPITQVVHSIKGSVVFLKTYKKRLNHGLMSLNLSLRE